MAAVEAKAHGKKTFNLKQLTPNERHYIMKKVSIYPPQCYFSAYPSNNDGNLVVT